MTSTDVMTSTPGFTDCITSCSGLPNGDYQLCTKCNFYATCSGRRLFERPCPEALVWDDVAKICQGTSSTCFIDHPDMSDTTERMTSQGIASTTPSKPTDPPTT